MACIIAHTYPRMDASAASRKQECWSGRRELGVDLKRSFVMGDRYGDIEAATRAGHAVFWCARFTAKASWLGTRRSDRDNRSSWPKILRQRRGGS
jgi:beta-phosphoglucomutase-like phosphatase (HAD superfamily)